ncbi:unnamed protein product [Dovyalis caffra]|uniref:Ribosomal protein L31 n=1 Tax=Dovyalis caffra TaxID=77055 RepID=A0AAV1S805_9ROSI|nr:unnamed protein product [Dovyalis caffra]
METIKEGIKHWTLGPFHPVTITERSKGSKKKHFCLEWLDKQARNSWFSNQNSEHVNKTINGASGVMSEMEKSGTRISDE